MASQKKYEFHNMKMPEKFTENQRKIGNNQKQMGE